MGRLIPFVIVILLLLGLIIGIPFLLQVDSHRTQLVTYLSTQLHHPVQIAKLDAGFFPPTLRLHDVTISHQDGNPFLQAERIDVPLDWGGLFQMKIIPAEITLDHWVLTFARRPNGSWDWDEWSQSLSSLSIAEKWPMHKIAFHEGECHLKDAWAPVPQELIFQTIDGGLDRDAQTANVTSTLSGAGAPVALTFEGKGHFLASPQWEGDLRLTDEGRQWVVHFNDQAAKLDAQGQSQQWRLDNALALARFYLRWSAETSGTSAASMLDDWKIHINIDGDSTAFYQMAGLGGGPTEIKGNVHAGPAALMAHVTAAFQNVPVQPAAEALDVPELSDGKLTGLAVFDLSIASGAWVDLAGKGSVEIAGGRYVFPAASLKSLSRAHTMNYIKKKFPDFSVQGWPFKKLSLRWHMAKGLITLEQGVLNSGDIRGAMTGQLDGPRRGIDAYARLEIHEKSPVLIKDIPGHYVFGAPGHEQIQPIFGHLQGTWNEWILRAIVSRKIPAAVQSQLRADIKIN